MVQVVGLHPRLDEARASARPASSGSSLTPLSSTVWLTQRMPASASRAKAARAAGVSSRGWLAWSADVDRLARRLQRGDQIRRHALGLDHRHARVPAQHLDVRDRAEPPRRPRATRRGDSINGSPPVRITSQISGLSGDVGERRIERRAGERLHAARADHLAAEAEAAIDRADVDELQQHAVGIAVHDARHRRRARRRRSGRRAPPGADQARAHRARTGARSGRPGRRGRSVRPWRA